LHPPGERVPAGEAQVIEVVYLHVSGRTGPVEGYTGEGLELSPPFGEAFKDWLDGILFPVLFGVFQVVHIFLLGP